LCRTTGAEPKLRRIRKYESRGYKLARGHTAREPGKRRCTRQATLKEYLPAHLR